MGNFIEIIKNVATVLGCCISFITLLTLLIKPLRSFITTKIKKLVKIDDLNTRNTEQDEKLTNAFNEIEQLKSTATRTAKDVSDIKELIFVNERDRLRGELFNCGNRCRRGIPLTLEEFRYIQEVYKKYNSVLKCNSIGTDEYNFIYNYFHSNQNQMNIK